MHLTNDLAPEVGRPEALQKYMYILHLIFIFTAFQVFNENNTKFHVDTCCSIHLCWKNVRNLIAQHQRKDILVKIRPPNVATCPWHYGFSYRPVEMGKGRNCLWKEEDFEIQEIQAVSLCTHGLYSPSPGNECMQPAEFNSLLVYYYLKISFCIPFYRGFTFQQNIQKIHTIEKKKKDR